MAGERHFQVCLGLGPLQSEREARLKAALVERYANAMGAGPVRVLDLLESETVWRSLSECEVCGSVVCQGPAAHAEGAQPEGVERRPLPLVHWSPKAGVIACGTRDPEPNWVGWESSSQVTCNACWAMLNLADAVPPGAAAAEVPDEQQEASPSEAQP